MTADDAWVRTLEIARSAVTLTEALAAAAAAGVPIAPDKARLIVASAALARDELAEIHALMGMPGSWRTTRVQ